MRNADVVVIEAVDDAARQHCLSIRHAVFVAEQQVPPEFERDAFDAMAQHALALHDGVPVGTARVMRLAEPGTIRISRMAVVQDARRLGIGAALLHAIETWPSLSDIEHIVLAAQKSAVAFYARQGYEAVGEPFTVVGIAHMAMQKTLENKGSRRRGSQKGL